MSNPTLPLRASYQQIVANLSPLAILGIVVGIVMPLISALVYPTYVHTMPRAWLEWSRLLETPFVLTEIVVICWASRKGMDIKSLARSLPLDIKVATIILLFGVFASSIFISTEPTRSISISYITVVHLLFGLSVFQLSKFATLPQLNSFLYCLGIGLFVLVIITVWKFTQPPLQSEVPRGVIEWESALPGFIHVRHFGSWTGAITAGFMAILLYADRGKQLTWIRIFFIVALAMTVWSGTRAAILALALTAVILTMTRRKMPSFRAIGVLAILSGVAMIAAWLLIPYNNPFFMLFVPTDLASSNDLTSGRIELWTQTSQKWLESPWLGWGSGSQFWEVYVYNWPHTQPHNAILQFLISWGIIGALGALWLLGRATVAVHLKVKRQPALLPILAILYTLLLMSLFEGMLHYPRFIMLIFVAIGIILAYEDLDRPNGKLGTAS